MSLEISSVESLLALAFPLSHGIAKERSGYKSPAGQPS